jgi:hypothetical protein
MCFSTYNLYSVDQLDNLEMYVGLKHWDRGSTTYLSSLLIKFKFNVEQFCTKLFFEQRLASKGLEAVFISGGYTITKMPYYNSSPRKPSI